ELGIGLAVLARARIRGDRLAAPVAECAVCAEVITQCRDEAFLGRSSRQIAGVGLPAGDQAEDAPLPAEALEGQNLLVDPTRGGCAWRADDNHVVGALHRLVDPSSEVSGASQFGAVPKYRYEASGNDASG